MRTEPDLLREYYIDLYARRTQLNASLQQEGLSPAEKSELFKELQSVNAFLADTDVPAEPTGDPLVDKWEAALDAGEDIDLEEGLAPEVLARLQKSK